jgi:hypothetical protein
MTCASAKVASLKGSGPGSLPAPERELSASQTALQNLIDRLERILVLHEQSARPELLTLEDIAQWMKLSLVTVKVRVVTRQGFPVPFVPTGTPDATRLWFAEEVYEWTKSNRSSLPRGKKKAAKAEISVV